MFEHHQPSAEGEPADDRLELGAGGRRGCVQQYGGDEAKAHVADGPHRLARDNIGPRISSLATAGTNPRNETARKDQVHEGAIFARSWPRQRKHNLPRVG